MLAGQNPNVLVLMTDDHGAWAMPRYGEGLARHLKAPTLGWLADTGTTMTRAVTPCPVCSPARASFWTGLMPSAHGVHDWLLETPDCDHPGVTDRNLGQRMKEAGYHTIFSGKWHCGQDHRRHAGFDRWSSLARGTRARFGPQLFCLEGERMDRHGHQAPMVAHDAIRFLRERPEDQPFFAFVGFTDTHTPLDEQAPQRLRNLYRDIEIEPPHDEPYSEDHGRTLFPSYKDRDRHRRHLVDYLASVTMIDEQMGRIIDELDSQRVLDDTVILYTSDHGHMNGQRGLIAKGNSTVPQNLLHGALHVPCIWRGPDICGNTTRDIPVDHCDLHVSLADFAGCGPDDLADMRPGSSYLSHLRGAPADSWRDWQVCEYGNARAWIGDRWKYIERYPGPNGHFPDELYDLACDPGETTNTIEEHPEEATRCAKGLARFFNRYERPSASGRSIGNQPIANAKSPWTFGRPNSVGPAKATG